MNTPTPLAVPLRRFRRMRLAIGISLIGYWAALFTGTHIPMPPMSGLPQHADKGMHFVAYAGLSFLLGLWFSTARRLALRHYLLLFAATALYGAADELSQIPVGRHADVNDWLANCLGIAIGLTSLSALLLLARRKRRHVVEMNRT